jgi:bacillolysin
MRSRTLLAALVMAGVIQLGCSAGPSGSSEGASEAQASAIKKMEAETGHAWRVQYDTALGTPHHADGRAEGALAAAPMPAQATYAFLAKHREVFGMDDPAAEFTAVKEGRDEYGWTHVRLQQQVAGVPVFGGELLAHYDTAGDLTVVDTLYFPNLRSLDVNPALAAKDAVEKAVAHWQTNFQPTFETRDFDGSPHVRLGIYMDKAAKPTLAYSLIGHVDANEAHGPARMVMMIDAKTGGIIEAFDGLMTVSGSGVDEFGVTRTMEVSGSGSNFTMVDTTRTTKNVTTNNAKTAKSDGSVCNASSATGPWDKSCVSAHYFAEVVYDYYKQVHNRTSIDNNNMRMFSVVHYGVNYANAFWGSQKMTYGDGDGKQLLNLTRGLDVIAHEMTHGVTESTSKLGYTNGTQNGGMNEAMSDIFGALAEHWAQPHPVKNWQIGEDVAGPSLPGGALRFMDVPSKDGRSIEHAKNMTSTIDVHLSSGVPNNAMYLMTVGGTNKVSKISVNSGIGWDKAGKVMYLTQTSYLKSSDNFLQFANANLSSAKQLGLSQNEQNIIECAWIAVGGITAKTTCGDTTGGDGADGGTTMDSSVPPPPIGDGGRPDVAMDTALPPIDVAVDRGAPIDTGVPEASPPPDVTPPPVIDAGVVDARPDNTAPPVDATGGSGGSGGGAGAGGAAGSGPAGTGGGGTGGSGGSGGGSSGSAGASAGKAGSGGSTGGSGQRGGSAGTGGDSTDPGCGCTVPGQSAPVGKSTLALTLGFAAAIVSRRRRRSS